MFRTFCCVASAGLLLVSCSDSPGGSPRDAARDLGRDAALDRGADRAPADLGADVGEPADVGPGSDADLGAPQDGAPDAPQDAGTDADVGTDSAPSTAPVWGYVSRSATPVLDGKGPLYVAVFVAGLPIVQGSVPAADLSAPGSTVLYELYGVSAGAQQIGAFLDDNANALPMLPMADPGDLALSNAVTVNVGGGSQRQDLVLDVVVGGTADGGLSDAFANLGAIKGTVRATATPKLDGLGTLHVTLHAQPPPSPAVAGTSVANADLSSPFAVESFFLSGVQAGSYYLRAFLDDNGNVNPFDPSPDTDDLVHQGAIQVHVVAGTTNEQEVVLDAIQ